MELPSMQRQTSLGLQPPYCEHHKLLSHVSSEAPDPDHAALPPNHIAVPSTTTIPISRLSQYLSTELLVPHLSCVYDYLKYASQPSPIRSLHQRRADDHKIIVDERTDWHLVCWQNGVSIKPLPAYLLDYDFFRDHISCSLELHGAACGFLMTYTGLIRHQSDYRIACELGLVPDSIPWPAFAAFLADLRHHSPRYITPRYEYGELWLKELCVISWWVNGWEKRYYHLFADYVTFGLSNYAQLLAFFAVIGLALSALQVGLATDQGVPPGWFADMSWGLAVLSCLLVAGSVVGMGVFFAAWYVRNMRVALKYDKKERKSGKKGVPWELEKVEDGWRGEQ